MIAALLLLPVASALSQTPTTLPGPCKVGSVQEQVVFLRDYAKKPPFPLKGERHLTYTCKARKFLFVTTGGRYVKTKEEIR